MQTILHRNSKKIVCIFCGEILSGLNKTKIQLLLNKIKEIGSIRSSKVFFDHKLSPSEYNNFIKFGVSPMVVSSDIDMYMAIESLDSLFFNETDIIGFGVSDDKLLPVVIKAREKDEILIITKNKKTAENYLPYADYIIYLDLLEQAT